MAIIGIDLGTTYSEAAIAVGPDGEIRNVEDIPDYISGSCLTPSIVKFLLASSDKTEQRNLRVCVGGLLGAGTEEGIIRHVKRSMGSDQKYRTPNGKMVGPEVISALILKYIKRYAEERLHQEVTGAVITVPAYFGDRERKATEQAGRIAGLEVLQLVNEPTAAALALGLNNTVEGRILVYDLGGGTFDVTVMDVHDRTFEVLGTSGDRELGGKDFTNIIYELLKSDLIIKHGYDLDDEEESYNYGTWWDECEKAKRILSGSTRTTIRYNVSGSSGYTFTLTRDDFNRKTSHLLDITETCVKELLKEIKLTWNDINGILTVGGATAMPMVQKMLQRISCSKELISDHNPDLDVARGAAICARNLERGKSIYTLMDVVSQSLGAEVYKSADSDEFTNEKIIYRNTPISKAVKTKTFSVHVDNSTASLVVVKEGESSNPKHARTIGKATIPHRPFKKGHEIDYVFHLDASQLLHIYLYDHETSEKLGEFDINRDANLSEKEVQELAEWLLTVDFEG